MEDLPIQIQAVDLVNHFMRDEEDAAMQYGNKLLRISGELESTGGLGNQLSVEFEPGIEGGMCVLHFDGLDKHARIRRIGPW